MPENLRATSERQSSCRACLILDETAAVVFAPPTIARNLHDHFRNCGLECALLPGRSGNEVIDFGNPSADEERRIRAAFASWQAEPERESPVWCAWLAIVVVALGLLGMLTRW